MGRTISRQTSKKQALRIRRQKRARKKIVGSADRPRLAVFRSNRHISVQVIDDAAGKTLAFASTTETAVSEKGTTSNIEAAKAVGQLVGERAKAAGIGQVIFDRGGNRYHGRVAALADAAREAGLEF